VLPAITVIPAIPAAIMPFTPLMPWRHDDRHLFVVDDGGRCDHPVGHLIVVVVVRHAMVALMLVDDHHLVVNMVVVGEDHRQMHRMAHGGVLAAAQERAGGQ
jgi:hypothetical protein